MKFLFLVFLFSHLAVAETTEEYRGIHKWQIQYQFGFDYRLNTHQLAAGYFIKPDQLLTAKIGNGKDTHGSDEEKQFNAALQYKIFAGNSFYIAPEIYYINYHENDETLTFLDYDNERYTALGIGVRIGNQWIIKHFTIGCDWIGVGRNVVHWNRTDDFLSTPYTLTLLNTYIGVSF